MVQKALQFVIRGNPTSDGGNPIPYTRSTQRGQFKPNVVKYNAWKHQVSGAFYREFGLIPKDQGGADPYSGKCLESSKKLRCRMDIVIHWNSDHHGDPDNVWKGIADALFANDKYVAGSFDFQDSKTGKAYVEVSIIMGT